MRSTELTEQVDNVLEAIGLAKQKAVEPILTQQERIDRFLDTIIDFKEKLSESTDGIEDINKRIEKLTWASQPDSDSILVQLKDLIDACLSLHKKYVKIYIGFKTFRQKGIAKDEIKRFKSTIDDLKEVTLDLESAFFIFPNNKEFTEITDRLKTL